MRIMTYQDKFCPALPLVYAGKDYNDYRERLVNADRILKNFKVEFNL